LSRLTTALVALAAAGCHDWDQFTREYVAPDGAAYDANSSDRVGSERGNYACASPHVMVAVHDARGPRIERVSLGGGRCAPLRVWGFGAMEPIRAIAVQGSRVLAAGDRGACSLAVSDSELRGSFSAYPGGGEVRDALVFNDGTPRFAVAVAVGTVSAINHLYVEDNNGDLSRDITTSSSPRIPAAIASAFMRSIASEPDDPHRLFAVLEQSEYLVSVQPNGANRQVLLVNTPPGLFETVAASAPNAMGQHFVAMVPRGREVANFEAFVRGTRITSAACGTCRAITHVVPTDRNEPTFAVLCSDTNGERALRVYRNGSCSTTLATWPAGTLVGRMAAR
jgi:hypothetical protein